MLKTTHPPVSIRPWPEYAPVWGNPTTRSEGESWIDAFEDHDMVKELSEEEKCRTVWGT